MRNIVHDMRRIRGDEQAQPVAQRRHRRAARGRIAQPDHAPAQRRAAKSDSLFRFIINNQRDSEYENHECSADVRNAIAAATPRFAEAPLRSRSTLA